MLTNGFCVRSYSAIGIPAGQAGLALPAPFSVGAGLHAMRVSFTAGGQVRTVLWAVNLT